MTEPSPARPVPGPLHAEAADQAAVAERFDDLDRRPVAEHVAVFEAEYDRLQRELGTIDQL